MDQETSNKNLELIIKYPKLADYMRPFKKGIDPLANYRRFMLKFSELQKNGIKRNVDALEHLNEMGLTISEARTHFTNPDNIRYHDFFDTVS
jgi:hypothetical protein